MPCELRNWSKNSHFLRIMNLKDLPIPFLRPCQSDNSFILFFKQVTLFSLECTEIIRGEQAVNKTLVSTDEGWIYWGKQNSLTHGHTVDYRRSAMLQFYWLFLVSGMYKKNPFYFISFCYIIFCGLPNYSLRFTN